MEELRGDSLWLETYSYKWNILNCQSPVGTFWKILKGWDFHHPAPTHLLHQFLLGSIETQHLSFSPQNTCWGSIRTTIACGNNRSQGLGGSGETMSISPFISFLLPSVYFLQRGRALGAELRESRTCRTVTKDLLVPPGLILSFAEASMPQLVFTTSLDIHQNVICKMHSAKVLPQGTWNSNVRREMQETNAWQDLAFRKELSGNRVPTFHRTVNTQEWSRGMCAILTLEFGG